MVVAADACAPAPRTKKSAATNADRISRLDTRWVLFLKDAFDRLTEETSDFEREWKARVVLVDLECIDGLPADAEQLSEFGLRPIVLGAENPQPVAHLAIPPARNRETD